jgi:hypothetical protein
MGAIERKQKPKCNYNRNAAQQNQRRVGVANDFEKWIPITERGKYRKETASNKKRQDDAKDLPSTSVIWIEGLRDLQDLR